MSKKQTLYTMLEFYYLNYLTFSLNSYRFLWGLYTYTTSTGHKWVTCLWKTESET